jgi:hypothetical protein
MTTPTPVRRRPPGRYDEPSRTAARALAVLLSVLFLGLLVAIGLLLFTRFGTAQIALQQRGFQVLSDDAVRVDFTATPPEGETVYCLVRARRADGAEVGARFVPVRHPQGRSRPVELSHTLDTTDRAVTGEVPRCTAGEPPTGTPTGQPDP